MVEQLLTEFEEQTQAVTLIPSRGGVFEVVVDGTLIYSKKATGRHAEYQEIADQIR
jgi:selenoprotein W-related protein